MREQTIAEMVADEMCRYYDDDLPECQSAASILAIPKIARALRIAAALDSEPEGHCPVDAAWSRYGTGWRNGYESHRNKLLKAGLPS